MANSESSLELLILELLVFPVIWYRSPNVVNSGHVVLQVVISSVLSIADMTSVFDFQVSISVVSPQLILSVRDVFTVVALHTDALVDHSDVSIKKEFSFETFLTLITIKQDLVMNSTYVGSQVRFLTEF